MSEQHLAEETKNLKHIIESMDHSMEINAVHSLESIRDDLERIGRELLMKSDCKNIGNHLLFIAGEQG